MRNTFLVAVREFRHRVRSRGFIIGSIVTPVIFIIIWAATGSFGGPEQPSPEAFEAPQEGLQAQIGYVDQAGLIEFIPEPVPPQNLHEFPTRQAAEQALTDGEIDAFYVIPADYRQTGEVLRVSEEIPGTASDTGLFDFILTRNLLASMDVEHAPRLEDPFRGGGPDFVSLTPEGEGEGQGGAAGFNMLPFLVTVIIMIPLFTSGSYLLQSVTQEKSSRVIEILLVSLRPRQLLGGKLLGLGALTLVQYLIWVAIIGAGMLLTGQDVLQLLSGINFSTEEVLLIIPYALGGYALYAALMAGIGALSPDMESSRSWIFILTLPMMIPIYLWTAIASAPNGILAQALSLIPFSAPVAMLMRMTTTTVPFWQLITSLGLLVLTAVGMIWLMGRLFRVQTLLSGEPFSISRMWSVLTE